MRLGIGKYGQHNKLSVQSNDDDGDGIDKEIPYNVTYIGRQTLSTYGSLQIPSIVNKIYTENYSPIGALINTKKQQLSVDSLGITVYQPGNKKTAAKVFVRFKLCNILFITTDFKHNRIFAVVNQNLLNKVSVHVYLCDSDEDAKSILDECFREFSQSPQIKKIIPVPFSEGLEFIDSHLKQKVTSAENYIYKQQESPFSSHPKPSERNLAGNVLESEENDFAKFEHHEFGEFHSSPVLKSPPSIVEEHISEINPESSSHAKLQADDHLDEEFSQLALKRNVFLPDHLQDKTIQSALLVQDLNNESSLLTQENVYDDDAYSKKISKSSLFSSYNRL